MTVTGRRKSSRSSSYNGCVEVSSWRTSSYSAYNGNCLEAGNWRSSSGSASTECLEAASCRHGIGVRDSKLGLSSPVLTFGAEAWRQFLGRVRADD